MIRTLAAESPTIPLGAPNGHSPPIGFALVVTARPGQESAELGGLLYAFRRGGIRLGLLCLTHGEASPLNPARSARSEAVAPWELQLAANVLGISSVAVESYPHGRLGCYPSAELTERVRRAIRQHCPDLLVVVDPEKGDLDDVAVAMAARTAAAGEGVPVAARTGPGGRGAWVIELGAEAATARTLQQSALAAHASQSERLAELARRIDPLDGREYLRWLEPLPGPRSTNPRTP